MSGSLWSTRRSSHWRTAIHPKTAGDRSEAHVLAALVERYDAVYLPWGENTRVDFVVAEGRDLLRIQVKSGRLRDGVIAFNTCSFTYHHPGNRGTKPYRQDYRGQIDLFAVWCSGTRAVYLVPVDDVPKNGARLRLHPTRNNQAAGVRWAADHQLHPPE